jgi:hypothetical protein
MTTYQDDVRYIELMRPEMIEVGAQEFHRVARFVAGTHGTFDQARSQAQWSGDAAELYRARLTDAARLVEWMRDAFVKAGRATEEYAEAVVEAKRLVAEGNAAAGRLAGLIGQVLRLVWVDDPHADPVRTWETMRWSKDFLARATRVLQTGAIAQIKAEGDALYQAASAAYAAAVRVETQARAAAVAGLRQAERILPSIRSDAEHRAGIVDASNLDDRVRQIVAHNPDARRPGQAVLAGYQMAEDTNTVRYPEDLRAVLAGQREVTATEAKLLDGLAPWQQVRFRQLVDEVYDEAGRHYSDAQGTIDNHNDAFRHVYWSAMLSREFGAEFAQQYTSAHETAPWNTMAGSEAMDLYNNRIGLALAAEHPDASPAELARLADEAVRGGRAVVIGPDGTPMFADTVVEGGTGRAPRQHLAGHPLPQ